MNLIEIVILIFIVQISSFLMFLMGMYIKDKGSKNVNLNPIEAIKEKRVEKEKQKGYDLEQRQKQTMIENINNYDGTSIGQKDIPME